MFRTGTDHDIHFERKWKRTLQKFLISRFKTKRVMHPTIGWSEACFDGFNFRQNTQSMKRSEHIISVSFLIIELEYMPFE